MEHANILVTEILATHIDISMLILFSIETIELNTLICALSVNGQIHALFYFHVSKVKLLGFSFTFYIVIKVIIYTHTHARARKPGLDKLMFFFN